MNRVILVLIILLSFNVVISKELNVKDVPWDDGKALMIEWNLDVQTDSIAILKLDSLGVYTLHLSTNEPTGSFVDNDLVPNAV